MNILLGGIILFLAIFGFVNIVQSIIKYFQSKKHFSEAPSARYEFNRYNGIVDKIENKKEIVPITAKEANEILKESEPKKIKADEDWAEREYREIYNDTMLSIAEYSALGIRYIGLDLSEIRIDIATKLRVTFLDMGYVFKKEYNNPFSTTNTLKESKYLYIPEITD
jgi:hypothetical protein